MPNTKSQTAEIIVLQHDMENVNNYCTKMDKTIEKIEELLHTMVRMVELHEERINVHVKDDDEFQVEVLKSISELKTELKEELSTHRKEIKKLNMLRYVVFGACSVILYIVGTALPPFISGWTQAFLKHT